MSNQQSKGKYQIIIIFRKYQENRANLSENKQIFPFRKLKSEKLKLIKGF